MTLPRAVVEAAEYFARRQATPNDEALENEIRAWRNESEQHRAAYREVERLHEHIDLMKAWGLLLPPSKSLPSLTAPEQTERLGTSDLINPVCTITKPTHIRLFPLFALAVGLVGVIVL